MDVAERVYKDSAFREKLMAWLVANGIDDPGRTVPIAERPFLADGKLTIRLFTLNAKGNVQFDLQAHDDRPLTHEVTVPVIVQPDADVQTWLR